MIRPRGGTTRRGGDGRDGGLVPRPRPSVTALRRARVERGLDLLAVHDRLGRPITQIEALEIGDMAALPDEALAVSTLRRYATFLGLDEDALTAGFRRRTGGRTPSTRPPGSTPAVTSVVAAVTTGPDHLRAFTETGEVPQVGGRVTSAAGTSGNYEYAVSAGPPTGTFPVVPRSDLRKSRRQVARARRRMHAPTVAQGRHLDPRRARPRRRRRLRAAGRPTHAARRRPHPAGGPGGLRRHGVLRRQPARRVPPVHQTFPVQPTGSTSSSAAYSVATSTFTVVVATSGPCWVQVTSSSSAVPLLSGVQPAAKVLSFPSQGTMTVEVGSSAVLVGVTIKGRSAFTQAPSTRALHLHVRARRLRRSAAVAWSATTAQLPVPPTVPSGPTGVRSEPAAA